MMGKENEIKTILVYNSSFEIASATISENASELDKEEVGMLDANSTTTDGMCTQLSGLDLVNVFTRMDIGNTDFWGSLSTAWVTSFIMYYVLLTILLVCMVCSYSYFIRKGLRFSISRLIIIILFISWSCFSCVHNGLLMNSVVNGSNMQLANTARGLEIIASTCFINFAILAILSDSSPSQFRCIWPSVIPVYLITGFTIIISLLAKGSALAALILLRSLILIISVILVNLKGGCKKQCHHATIKEHLCLFLKQKKTLILLYFFLSYGYFSYTSITVLSNSNCIEDIQLHRAIWLVFNCLLRIFEVGFSIIYLIQTRNIFKILSTLRKDKQSVTTVSKDKGTFTNWIKSPFGRQMDRRSPLKPSGFTYQPSYEQEPPKNAIHHNFSSGRSDNTTVVFNHACKPKEQKDQVVVIHHDHLMNGVRSGMIEIEPLFQSLNNCRHYSDRSTDLEATLMESSCLSDSVTCSLSTDSSSKNSRASSDESLYITGASSIISDVVIVSAQPPVYTEYLVGGTEFKMFDERGGVFHSYNHGVTVIVPPGAIPSRTLAELKFAAMLVAPVKFTSVAPVSAIFWLCMEVVLQKPLQIRLPEMLTKARSSGLQFAKSLHSAVTVIDQQMNIIEGGKFIAGQNYASIEVDHFCYYCITRDQLDPNDIPQNQYLLIAMKQHHSSPKDTIWNVDLCIVPRIRTCEKYLKSQYNNDWKLEILLDFNFDEDGCNELQIKFSSDSFGNSAKVEVLSDKKIEQKDIDFHEYYTNGKLDDLKYRMDRKLYPPRRKARVQAKHSSFFESSKTLDYCLTFSKKCITGKIIIPCHNIDSYEASSSESDSSLQRNKSLTSGYRSRSDESLECIPDEKEFYSGDLQLRNLILQTKKVEHKWFELGVTLGVPIDKLERIHDKHYDSPIKALIRVYRYWLSDKNGLMPTWKKLVIALQKIDEYGLSNSVSKHMPQDDDPHPAVFSDVSSQAMKELVMKYMQPILLNFTTLVPVLNKYNLLTQSDNYILMNIHIPPVERANALVYQILPSKGPRAYEMFIKSLQEETEHLGHQELAKKFILLQKPKRLETTV